MVFVKAIVRKPNINFAAGVTSVSWEQKPDYELICNQHKTCIETLSSLGLEMVVLEPEPDFPDSYFIEDTAVMLAQTAMVTRPGDDSRLREPEKTAPTLKKFRELEFIREPGLLDGGDVMLIEKHFFIGLSKRTNKEGALQIGEAAGRQGFTWSTLPVLKALHLKTGVNYIGQNTLLMFEEYVSRPEFNEYNKILIEKDEEPAANTLLINDNLLIPKGFPKTKEKLESFGKPVIELDISEIIKMDGGLSCLSLRF